MVLNENGLKDRARWEEKGYHLPQYDRALGATYLNGLWEAIDKSQTRK